MNRETLGELTRLIRRLTEHLFAEDFPEVMLGAFSSLFDSSRVALLSGKKEDFTEAVSIVELAKGGCREDFVLRDDFLRRFGAGLAEAASQDSPSVQSLPDGERAVVFPARTEKHTFLLVVSEPRDEEYLSEEHLAVLASLVEFGLSARLCARKIMGLKDLDLNEVTLSSHRIKSTLSSISTALDMLVSRDLNDEDRREVMRLGQKGLKELEYIIDGACRVSRLEADDAL